MWGFGEFDDTCVCAHLCIKKKKKKSESDSGGISKENTLHPILVRIQMFSSQLASDASFNSCQASLPFDTVPGCRSRHWCPHFFFQGERASNMDVLPGSRTTPQKRGAVCWIGRLWSSASPSRCEPSPGWIWDPGPVPSERPAYLWGHFMETATHQETQGSWDPLNALGDCWSAGIREWSPGHPAVGVGCSYQGRECQSEDEETNKPRAPTPWQIPKTRLLLRRKCQTIILTPCRAASPESSASVTDYTIWGCDFMLSLELYY